MSFGGGLALELYGQRPDLLKTLILVSAYAGWSGSLPEDVVQQRLAKVEREAALPPQAWIPEWIPGLLTESAPAELVDELVEIMSESHPGGMRTMAHAFAEADLRGVLPHIRIPTLLLYGQEDRRTSEKVAADLHASTTGSKLVFIPDVGHQCNMEMPERFNDEVRAFLQGV
jgi:pimeloyl-ACP methyl ester carboxylesterase